MIFLLIIVPYFPLFNSLFQVVESVGDLAERFNISNVAGHDSCSALIKVKTTPKEVLDKTFISDFTK